MTSTNPAGRLGPREIQELRRAYYNATVVMIRHVHADLMILRVRPDMGTPGYLPGQYTVLGLGNWEPRAAGVQAEHLIDATQHQLVKRAYSFSCPMLDAGGNLLPPGKCDFLEFYIVLIRRTDDQAPGLTPRLFELDEGERLFIGPKVTGHYTLDAAGPEDHLVFVATGTGEAPHNTMIAQRLSQAHRGQLTAVTCVRYRRDLGYLETHRELEKRYSNYRYLALTTREPENLDASLPNYVGKVYLQDYFASGTFENESGLTLDSENTHVYLCGNPAMIGAPGNRKTQEESHPGRPGMVDVLQRRGFQVHRPGAPGRIHFEKYW